MYFNPEQGCISKAAAAPDNGTAALSENEDWDCCPSSRSLLDCLGDVLRIYSATSSMKRMKMVATCARVALPSGVRVLLLVPVTSPSALAHWRAGRA